jgi:hypothetical protein
MSVPVTLSSAAHPPRQERTRKLHIPLDRRLDQATIGNQPRTVTLHQRLNRRCRRRWLDQDTHVLQVAEQGIQTTRQAGTASPPPASPRGTQ